MYGIASNMQKEYFRTIFRQAGYKATPARVTILTFLTDAKKPVSVPELVQKLGAEQIDAVTAYRTLNILKAAGLVRQIDFHHDHAYYELTSWGEHHHAICVQCDRIEDIKDCCVETMEKVALEQSGFSTITQHSLEFFGICKQCALSS